VIPKNENHKIALRQRPIFERNFIPKPKVAEGEKRNNIAQIFAFPT
jgi:hypothetical protein